MPWALTYGSATLLALYAGYSTLYALLPQGLIFVWVFWRSPRDARLRLVGGALVTALFGLWLPLLLKTVARAGNVRAD